MLSDKDLKRRGAHLHRLAERANDLFFNTTGFREGRSDGPPTAADVCAAHNGFIKWVRTAKANAKEPAELFEALQKCAQQAKLLEGKIDKFRYMMSTDASTASALKDAHFLFTTPDFGMLTLGADGADGADGEAGEADAPCYLTIRMWHPIAGATTPAELVHLFETKFAEQAQGQPGFQLYFGCVIEDDTGIETAVRVTCGLCSLPCFDCAPLACPHLRLSLGLLPAPCRSPHIWPRTLAAHAHARQPRALLSYCTALHEYLRDRAGCSQRERESYEVCGAHPADRHGVPRREGHWAHCEDARHLIILIKHRFALSVSGARNLRFRSPPQY
jgi:hypothetical protein